MAMTGNALDAAKGDAPYAIPVPELLNVPS
jgi:hypothetical protein